MPTIGGYTIYNLIQLFFVYAFLGWCSEVAYAALKEGRFVNRGFLNGPICPIYGVGAATVAMLLTPFEERPVLLFFAGAAITSLIEFFTGLILEKIFHMKWWDYTDEPFNILGYVCLRFSVYWGIACVSVMKLLHPTVQFVVGLLPHVLGIVVNCLLLSALAVDLVSTVTAINALNKRLSLITETAKNLHNVSNAIGEKVFEGTTLAAEKGAEAKNAADNTREQLDEQRLLMEGRLQLMQMRSLENSAQRAAERADALEQLRAAAEQRTVSTAEDLLRLRNAENPADEAAKLRAERKAEREKQLAHLKANLSRKDLRQDRLLKAFPRMRLTVNQGALNQLRLFRRAEGSELQPDTTAILNDIERVPARPKKLTGRTAAVYTLGLFSGAAILLLLELLAGVI